MPIGEGERERKREREKEKEREKERERGWQGTQESLESQNDGQVKSKKDSKGTREIGRKMER